MMKPEQTMKFKKLFENQKTGLLYSHKYISEDFSVKSEDRSDETDLASAELEQ